VSGVLTADHGDARLAARDRALPGLATVLDDDAFAEVLAKRLPAVGIRRARGTYARYKPGVSCLVAYRVEVSQPRDGAVATTQVYARAQRPRDSAKLRKVQWRATAPSVLGPGGLLVEELGLAVYAFPNDRRLPSLARLRGSVHREQLLKRLVPQEPALWRASMRTLRYKPERRYVAVLVAGDRPRALLKAYDDGFGGARRRAGALADALLPLPRVMGGSRRHRALVLEWLDGHSLDEALETGAWSGAAVTNAAALLAALHSRRIDGLPAWSPTTEASRIRAAAQAVAATLPDLEAPTARLARRLGGVMSETNSSGRFIHADFSADQVIFCRDSCSIIDLDSAMSGPPSWDLASFVARLERDVVSGRLTTEVAEEVRGEFLEAYAQAASTSVRLADRCVAAALLRLAPEPFRRREPDWTERTEMMLDRVAELAANG